MDRNLITGISIQSARYTKADWLKDGMQIDTSIEPLEELKHFEV